MVKKADIGTKRLISLAPEHWVQWVTQQPDIQVEEFLSTEFEWIGRESDVLIKVFSPQWGEFILLHEFQLKYKAEMPLRMRAYTALAEEKLKLPIYPVLINILSRGAPSEIPQ
ncbi:MAG: hypothetical protein RLZZ148_408, partial [Cyanobacteriota bacterium]